MCKGLHSRRFSSPTGHHCQTDRSISELIHFIHLGYIHAEANPSAVLAPEAYQAAKRLVATRDISKIVCNGISSCIL